jgi:heptosyltransferase-2
MPEKSDQPAQDKIRILVVQTAFLGDIILTTPLLLALKAAYPNAHLALLTTPIGKSALEGLPELDEIISYDKNGTERGLSAFFGKAKEIRQKKFDLALSAHRSFRSALLLAFSRIPILVGFEDASLHRIYHLRVKRKPSDHEVLRNLSLMDPVKEIPRGFEPKVQLPLPKNFSLEKFGVDRAGKTLVGFAPGSAWPTKQWPAERFAELARKLAKDLGAKIVLLGDKADLEVCREIEKGGGNAVDNFCGKTSIQELFGVVSKLDALVTNDSAPVHIASAFSIPAVVIFGPTTPAFGYGPWLNPHQIIEKEVACRPCHHHGPVKCPEGHFKCMLDVGAGEVAEAVMKLLKGKGGS